MIVYVHGRLARHRRLQTVALCTDKVSAERAAQRFLQNNARWSGARVWIDCEDVTERLKPKTEKAKS